MGKRVFSLRMFLKKAIVKTFESLHDKTNKMTFVPSEDSDQMADAQADLRLRWALGHFVGFVMRRLI